MYTVTPRTMTALVFAMIALTFGGILAGFGFALLTERPSQPAPTDSTPGVGPALSRSIVVPAANAAGPAPVEAEAAVPEPPPFAPTPASVRPALQRPARTVVGEAASVTLETAQVNRREGGIEVAIRLQNEGDQPLSFPFSPGQNLVVEDDRGHVYQVRWASYDGEVRLAAGQSTYLARALFTGPIDQPGVSRVQIRTRDLPGIAQASWQVEIGP